MKHVTAYRLIEFNYTEGLDELIKDQGPLTDDDLRTIAENDFAEDVQQVDMVPTVIVSDEPVHVFDIRIRGCTLEQAEQVLCERLGFDEDYGFHYSIDW